jgi:hypothetical protein
MKRLWKGSGTLAVINELTTYFGTEEKGKAAETKGKKRCGIGPGDRDFSGAAVVASRIEAPSSRAQCDALTLTPQHNFNPKGYAPPRSPTSLFQVALPQRPSLVQ